MADESEELSSACRVSHRNMARNLITTVMVVIKLLLLQSIPTRTVLLQSIPYAPIKSLAG